MLPPRHSYSEQAGKNVANPAAMLLCAANFLDYACLNDHASRSLFTTGFILKRYQKAILHQGTQQRIGSIKRGPSENKGPGRPILKYLWSILQFAYCQGGHATTRQFTAAVVQVQENELRLPRQVFKPVFSGNGKDS